MKVEKGKDYIVKYSCSCRTVEILSKDIPEWPWIDSGRTTCLVCGMAICSEVTEEDANIVGGIALMLHSRTISKEAGEAIINEVRQHIYQAGKK
ncbi:hypothetical protein LCGC14_0580670 [marine sediment metagenome]|uniref:Uncharacterized protein n=1 Tax=marine sediment metagenome TaxID=412755 RepID=A0A0F9RGG3_9ZZZZ